MKYTDNLGLKKPDLTDYVNVEDFNENSDVVDLEIDTVKKDLGSHKAESVHKDEVHGFRTVDGKLEWFDGEKYVKVSSGGAGVPLDNIKNFTAKIGNAQVTLNWEDPSDILLDGVIIAKWVGTKILRKLGSYPANVNDGVLVVDSGVRNQYKTNAFLDTGLINDREYFYMAFPYTEYDLYTSDITNRVSATPSDKDDMTNSPGSKYLQGGDMQAGYFGVVPASELFTGPEIASACGITQGTSQFANEGWLKFAIDGKIIFKSQKTYRHSISWYHINSVGAVKGTKQVTKSGNTYKVRLMMGGNGDASDSENGSKNSEWNKLMLPIHIKAKNQIWDYSQYVNIPTPYWGIDFTDADLQTHSNHGDGSYQWCQEFSNISESFCIYRGCNGVSNSLHNTSTYAKNITGWSPILEYVE